jgi:GrpB-like predicted nucleotidyltransferase (UPF0157 family)
MNKYKFLKYKKEYKKLFEKEKNILMCLIPEPKKIEHVGSTSVPGLGGKGIIDILIIIDRKKMSATMKKLKNRGYEKMNTASSKDRISLKKIKGIFFKKRFHIHLTYPKSKTQKETIKFRNRLLKNEKIRISYINLKKEAVKKSNGNGKTYRKLKEDFIKKHSK